MIICSSLSFTTTQVNLFHPLNCPGSEQFTTWPHSLPKTKMIINERSKNTYKELRSEVIIFLQSMIPEIHNYPTSPKSFVVSANMPFTLLEAGEYFDTMFGGGFKYHSLHTAGSTVITQWTFNVKPFVDNFVPIITPCTITTSSIRQSPEPGAHMTPHYLLSYREFTPSTDSQPDLQESQSTKQSCTANSAPNQPILLSCPILTKNPSTPTLIPCTPQTCTRLEGMILTPVSPKSASHPVLTNK
jgi:hypothetical protein